MQKKFLKSITTLFDSMGIAFAKVVTLIVAGETFANGLKKIGAIDTIINSAQSSGSGTTLMVLIMTGIITICAIVMGSGNAPFFAFASLVPDIASKMSIPAIFMLLPMQLASGIARSISPITAVIVAVFRNIKCFSCRCSETYSYSNGRRINYDDCYEFYIILIE